MITAAAPIRTSPETVTAAPMANALFPPELPVSSASSDASAPVDRLNPWASFNSVSVEVIGWAALSMELDSAGASVLLSPASVSEEPEADDPWPLWTEAPGKPEIPLPALAAPALPLSEAVLPAAASPLPEDAVTIVAFMSVLFPAV